MGDSVGQVLGTDPKGISTWPRRLVHLPSFSSLEWQPGHTYGPHQHPKYNAISYTWGRFRLDTRRNLTEALRKVKGIGIDNCPWTVPPIDPARFTVEEFRTALHNAATSDGGGGVSARGHQFVWLDVACIDQSADAGKLEIGRQAAIFRGAQRVYIWLTKFLSPKLEKILTDVVDSSRSTYSSRRGKMAQALVLTIISENRASPYPKRGGILYGGGNGREHRGFRHCEKRSR